MGNKMFPLRCFLTICLSICGSTVIFLHLLWSSKFFSSSSSSDSIHWHDNWAFGCTFGEGNDLANERSMPAYQCNDRCSAVPECTHFVWTAATPADLYDGRATNGICKMKTGGATKADAEIIVASGKKTNTVCGLAQKTVSWFGNWALGCAFNRKDDASSSWSSSQHPLVRDGSVVAKVTGLERDKCSGRCASTEYCSHFVWTNGDCWLGRGRAAKADAVVTGDMSMVCGVVNDDGSLFIGAGESP